MRISPDRWIVNRYPLIDAGLTRDDCITWFTERYPDRILPRSACVDCPYRSPRGWVRLRDQDPESFADAVRTDTMLRSRDHHASSMFRNQVFLRPRRIPLADAVAVDAAADGDLGGGWGNECAGVCDI